MFKAANAIVTWALTSPAFTMNLTSWVKMVFAA